MHYISTRRRAPVCSFSDIVLAGLASDGGLYVPESIPHISTRTLSDWSRLSYSELATEIMHPFMGDAISKSALHTMLNETYASFRHPAIAPLVQLDAQHFLLELFHGPTLAFKDFALQFLGRMIEHLLHKTDEKIVVLGATSGDTGSAAIAGCKGRANMDMVILYPDGRVSDVQRRQMTTTQDKNVHALALDGAFDDCQDIVKTLFADADFRHTTKLVAVNSINWARILAQIVYYFYAAFALGAPARSVSFCVPTGNFGDIFAGTIAKKMGLPIDKLIIASNLNDILPRTHATGIYQLQGVRPSLSPSMDIQISSNFERLLFDLHGRDGALIESMMREFRHTQSLTLNASAYHDFKRDFAAHSVSDNDTLLTIKSVYDATGYTLDPHTATGVAAAQSLRTSIQTPIITLATAHPAKFPDAVKQATGNYPALPAHLSDLFARDERITRITNSADAVKSFINALD